ncbi:MAG TPA: HU family DNA-binding protein [Alcanivorax sp.]|nr:HU family DNA-binding protein [Alcanivorax sp.]
MKEAFINRLHAQGYSKTEAAEMLDIFAEEVTKALDAQEEVKLPKLGKLTMKLTAERPGRNPATGEPVTIPARWAVRFKASKVLTDQFRDRPTETPFD